MKRLVLATLLLCAHFAAAQLYDYVGTLSDGVPSSNLTWAKTHNAWHLSNNTLVGVMSGGGQAGGWNSAGQAFLYNDYPTNTWTVQTAMGTVHALAIGGSDQIWSLGASTTGGYAVQKWSGSAWTTPYGGALVQLNVKPDGTVCGANSQGQAFYNTGSGWATYPGQGWAWIDCIGGASLAVGIKTDQSIWMWQGSAWAAMGGAAVQAAMDTGGNVYVINSAGLSYHWNGTGWDLLAGTGFTSLANGNTGQVWTVGPNQSGSNVYRFQDVAFTATASMTGNTNCSGGFCPPGAQHTWSARVSGAFSHNDGGIYSPTQEINSNFNATANDVFGCLEGNYSACGIDLTTNVTCNLMGTLETGGLLGSGLGGTIHIPCWPPIPNKGIGWPPGATVDVYLDVNSIPGGTQYTAICAGITTWAAVTGTSYHCHSSNGVPTPEPSGKYIFVQMVANRGYTDPCGPTQYRQCPSAPGPNLRHAYMNIDNTLTTVNQWTGEGSHEEGHDNFMGDCPGPDANPPNPNGCYTRESVMGGQPTSSASQPLAPTPCDYIWFLYNKRNI